MTYDRGRLTLGNTGNKFLNVLGGAAILKTNEESKRLWEEAGKLAEKEGALAEPKKKKEDLENYEFEEIFDE